MRMRIYLTLAVLIYSFIVISPTVYAEEKKAIIFTLPASLGETQEDRDALKKLADVINKLTENYHRKISGKEFSKLMVQGLTSIDPHTSVASPETAREIEVQAQGQFGGIGAEIQKNQKGGILIITPIDGTPADKAGIKPGDIIIAVDEKSIIEISLRDAIKLLRGKPGTTVTLTIAREDKEGPFKIVLTRAIIRIQFVKSELKKDGFGYIRLSSFSILVPLFIAQAVKELKEKNNGENIKGLILDLRRNPGGLLIAADGINDLFLDAEEYVGKDGVFNKNAAKTISIERRGSLDDNFFYAGVAGDILNGAPLLILVDRGSASASEIVAKVLKIHGRATIAGPEKTFGKGTVQTIIPLSDGRILTLTTSQYVIGPTGCEQPVQGVGVIPDILLQSEAEKPSFSRRESDLQNALSMSAVSSADCKYKKVVSAEHKEAALKMLEVMGLKPLKKSK